MPCLECSEKEVVVLAKVAVSVAMVVVAPQFFDQR
jgi:hypothetical protein